VPRKSFYFLIYIWGGCRPAAPYLLLGALLTTVWIYFKTVFSSEVEASWNVMAHAQKPDFFFRRNGRVHLNRRGRQFSLLLAAEVCASAVVMLDTPCSEVVWRVLATHSRRQFPLHFPSRASPCAITLQLESTLQVLFLCLLLLCEGVCIGDVEKQCNGDEISTASAAVCVGNWPVVVSD
jgi:hypothetical protein